MEQEDIFKILNEAYFSEHPDEETILQQLPKLLLGCSHFVDIGASLGQYTYHASKIIRNGRIDAFEADPYRATKLKDNCALWAATTGNTITTHHAAVAKTNGRITFWSTQSNVSGGLFPNALCHLNQETRDRISWTEIEVPAITLDEFYAASPPQFIKMDIEGAEGEALQGATRLLKLRKTSWLIELHGFEGGWQPQLVIAYMRGFGYGAKEVAESHFLFMPLKTTLLLVNKLKLIIKNVLGMHKHSGVS